MMAKEQNRFGEGRKNPRAQKVKPSTDKAHYTKQNVRNKDDA